jgi:hypothetical protein
MELNQDTMKLICELEYIIGQECTNSNYARSIKVKGVRIPVRSNYRYPVSYKPTLESDIIKSDTNLSLSKKDITKMTIDTMGYSMGTNYLHIGKGLVSALSELEKRYGIDFAELEKCYQERQA